MLVYQWSRNFESAKIFFRTKYLGDLVLFKRRAYLFNPFGEYRRFISEMEARKFVRDEIHCFAEQETVAK